MLIYIFMFALLASDQLDRFHLYLIFECIDPRLVSGYFLGQMFKICALILGDSLYSLGSGKCST